MITAPVAPLRARLRKTLAAQPEMFYDGDNWEGSSYSMTPANHRQKARITTALVGTNAVTLSRADWNYLYAVLTYAHSRRHPTSAMGRYGYYESYYRLPNTPDWSKTRKFFAALGITRPPAFHHAWSSR